MDQIRKSPESNAAGADRAATRVLESLSLDRADGPSNVRNIVINEKSFGMRGADTAEGRSRASMLINKRSAWCGELGAHRLEDEPNRLMLSAREDGDVVGTVTLSMDGESGLLADQAFKDKVDQYRARGGKVGEITRLAFDVGARSQAALASLLHVLFIYARNVHQCTDLLIEIHPRHRRFYETMLGFLRISELRSVPGTDAPAYLLWVSVAHVAAEVARFGGKPASAADAGSLFPYFFSPREERGIASRICSLG